MTKDTRRGRAAILPCLDFDFLTKICVLVFGMLLFASTGAYSQVYNGEIVGSITDSNGAAIPNVAVTATNIGTNKKYPTTTNNSGEYAIPQLPIGAYAVRAEANGFKEEVVNNVEVHVSTNTNVKMTLQIGTVSEKVLVQADAVQVQTTSAAVGEIISGTQVRELPLNGENFVGLTQLSPGVSAAASYDGTGKGITGGVNFSVNGNPYTNNLFLVDGVNNNDLGSNRSILIYPSVDSIAEFKMIRNSYGPEYGQASGAIISITTKSGTNQWHGGTFYAGRNDALDTNDWVHNDLGQGKGKLRRSDYGYNISGPAWKNRLFFWGNQEWNHEVRGAAYGTCVPTDGESAGNFSGYGTAKTDQCGATIPTIPGFAQGGLPNTIANPDKAGLLIAQFYPSPNFSTDQAKTNSSGFNWNTSINNLVTWSEWSVRGDWDVTKSNRATIRWTQDSSENPAPVNPAGFWGESAFPTVQSSWSLPSKSVMARLSSTISNSMVNDVEFGYGYNKLVATLAGTRADIVPAIQSAYPASFPSSIKTKDEFFGGWGGLNPYGSYNGSFSMWNIAPYNGHEDLYAVQDNLSKVQGNHLLKAGVYVSSNTKIESIGNGADRPGLPSNLYCENDPTGKPYVGVPGHPACAQTNNGLANILIPGTGSMPQEFNVSENSIDAVADIRWHDIEWYVGDSWKLKRNVTLDYGFRWSFYREPYSATNQYANWSLSNWSASEAKANPSDACNGVITVPGTSPCADAAKFLAGLGVNLPLSNGTPGRNRALADQNDHAIAARIGIAWDIRGDGKTALRAGGGQFYQRELIGLDEGLSRTAPYVINVNTNRAMDTPAPLANPSVSPNVAKSPIAVVPNSWQWNVTLEQQVARNSTLQIGYVANTGIHLTSNSDVNAVPQSNWLQSAFTSGAAQNALRPAFNFSTIQGYARAGHASYNSLQALFRSQMGPSTFQAAYTWSHSIGNVDLDSAAGSYTTNPLDPGLDKGNTNINRPNVFVANEAYYLPKLQRGNKFVQQTLGGWEASSIFTAAEGSSLSVFSSGVSGACTNLDVNGNCISGYSSGLTSLIGNGYSGNNRPLATGVSCSSGRKGNTFLNPAAFTLVGYAIGTTPSNLAGRGICFGAPTTNLDMQLAKNWLVKERVRVKFSMDFFDILNHPNFNSNSLEGTGYTSSSPVYCGGATPPTPGGGPTGLPCSQTNNIITSAGLPAGFGQTQVLQNGRSNRELQYTLRFSF
jgi:hypothetical protein